MFIHLSQDIGITPLFLKPVDGLCDMSFVCDSGLWIDDLFISANFWARPRQAEVPHVIRWFKKKGVCIKRLDTDALFEGGDCVMVKNKLIVGYGNIRTNARAVVEIETLLAPRGIQIVPVRRVTEEFYHLNSVLTYYPSSDTIAYFPRAFDKKIADVLSSEFPGTCIVALGEDILFRHHPDFGGEWLYSYALNAVEHRGVVLQPYCHPAHRELLESAGLRVLVPKDGSSEFERSGGSYRCLMMLHNTTP